MLFELKIVNLEQMIILHRYKISIIHWRHSEFCTKVGIWLTSSINSWNDNTSLWTML